MKIEQLYTACISQGAYFMASEGEAIVIDPLREPGPYLELAAKAAARITYIFETHFHADFVSGHLELARLTGATIVYGPNAETGFEAHIGQDNELFGFGKFRLRLLHTPGHTLESSCYLLEDEQAQPQAVFTGDTLFIGDVGRPDLAQEPKAGLTTQDLAGMLYDSLRTKLLVLPDEVMIYPAHGAGSACGKNMSRETSATLGDQRTPNYALAPELSRERFIKDMTEELSPAPAYFPMNVRLNSRGYGPLDELQRAVLRPLRPKIVHAAMAEGKIILLDSRDPEVFAKGHIPGSINIGLKGTFAPWVGALLPFEHSALVIVAENDKIEETFKRLARIGYEQILGYLDGDITGWTAAGFMTANVPEISAEDFMRDHAADGQVIDVRNAGELREGFLPGALHLPLNEFEQLKKVPVKDRTYYVYCAGGYRSMIFISLLRSLRGIQLVNISGGYNALKKWI